MSTDIAVIANITEQSWLVHRTYGTFMVQGCAPPDVQGDKTVSVILSEAKDPSGFQRDGGLKPAATQAAVILSGVMEDSGPAGKDLSELFETAEEQKAQRDSSLPPPAADSAQNDNLRSAVGATAARKDGGRRRAATAAQTTLECGGSPPLSSQAGLALPEPGPQQTETPEQAPAEQQSGSKLPHSKDDSRSTNHPVRPCALTRVTARKGTIDLGDKRVLDFPITAREIADDIAREINSDAGDASYFGVFVCAGDAPAEAELAEAYRKLGEFYKRLVFIADQEWERTHNYMIITDVQRRAARWLGLEKEWSYEPKPMLDCPACGEKVKPGVAVCRSCGAVLDRAKAVAFGLAPPEAPPKREGKRSARPNDVRV